MDDLRTVGLRRIRALRFGDRARLVGLRAELWSDVATDEHAAAIDAYLQGENPAASGRFEEFPATMLVAELDDGSVVGFAEVSVHSEVEGCHDDAPAALVDGWFVDAGAATWTVTAVLMRAVESWAREQGCTEIGARTDLGDARRHELQLALGYGEVRRVVQYRKTLRSSPPAVEVVAHDEAWAGAFVRLSGALREVLGERLAAVEHVGSTAVPGLDARAELDVALVVASMADFPEVIDVLVARGYDHEGDLGSSGRGAFRRALDGGLRHRLTIYEPNAEEFAQRVAFRDRLLRDPSLREVYGARKRSLAARYPNDLDAYLDGTRQFVEGVPAKPPTGR